MVAIGYNVLMILLLHIAIALSSVAYTTYLYISPSDTKFKVSYGFVAATLASGTYLVVSTGGHLLRSCITGLVYLGIVSFGIRLARTRYAHQFAPRTTDK